MFLTESYKKRLLELVGIMQPELVAEIRVPQQDRIDVYRDNNIVVVIPLTQLALKKYATGCHNH